LAFEIDSPFLAESICELSHENLNDINGTVFNHAADAGVGVNRIKDIPFMTFRPHPSVSYVFHDALAVDLAGILADVLADIRIAHHLFYETPSVLKTEMSDGILLRHVIHMMPGDLIQQFYSM
jgi:hypothetical protein